MLEPKDSEAGIVYLAFSVIVVTEDNPYVELMSFGRTSLVPGDEPTFSASSTKFNFTDSIQSPAAVVFYQWVTGRGGYGSNSINYWTYLKFSTNSTRPAEVNLNISWVGSRIYMTGVKVAVLMVSKDRQLSNIVLYETYSKDGGAWPRYFSDDLGVNSSLFRQPSTGQMCFSGLGVIDLYFYNTTSSNTLPTSLLFTYNGQNINGLTYRNIYGCNISTICLGACPPGSYFY